MNSNINSGSLFHFTRRSETLQKILQQGLRFSYAFECLWGVENGVSSQGINRGIGIPMISFCDIPLMRTSKHSAKYGKYAIGLNKEFLWSLKSDIMNPVLYVKSERMREIISTFSNYDGLSSIGSFIDDPPAGALQDEDTLSEYTKNVFETIKRTQRDTKYLRGLSKPYGGTNRHGKTECYYDEREWRIILPHTKWTGEMSLFDFNRVKNHWNTYDLFMTIPENDLCNAITHIIIRYESQRKKMIDYVLKSEKIFGSPISDKDNLLILISKITSLEQIEADY